MAPSPHSNPAGPDRADSDRAAPRARDPQAWLEAHGDALYRYCLLRLNDQTLAEDLVQETLLAAWKASDSFTGRSSERTWLIGILKHKIIDHVRKAAREKQVEVEEQIPDGGDPFNRHGFWSQAPRQWRQEPTAAFEQQEFWDVYVHCLGALPEQMAFAFSFREVEGLETEEICKILGVTPTNLWTLLHRARLRLRRCLEANWFGEQV